MEQKLSLHERELSPQERIAILEFRLDKLEMELVTSGLRARQWKEWECQVMNVIDIRYWNCECGYVEPYGRVISADCPRHGDW